MKRTILGLSFLAVAFSPAIYAHDMEMVKEKIHQISQKLDLTADQKMKIKAINQTARMQIKPLKMKMRHEHMEMKEMIASGKTSDLEIDRYVHREKDLFGDILKIRVHEQVDISKILTPEQKTKWHHMITKWKMKHMEKKAAE